jgi:hypothetical protein
MWELCNRRYPGYAVYQRRAGAREIPIVVLEPDSLLDGDVLGIA